MSRGAIDCSLVLLNVHAYIKRAIERLLHFNEVYNGLNERTVILLNQRSTPMNEYFALMTSKGCNSSVSNTELLNYRFFHNETPTAAKPELQLLYSRH